MPVRATVHAQASSSRLRFQTSTLLANAFKRKNTGSLHMPKPYLGWRDEELP